MANRKRKKQIPRLLTALFLGLMCFVCALNAAGETEAEGALPADSLPESEESLPEPEQTAAEPGNTKFSPCFTAGTLETYYKKPIAAEDWRTYIEYEGTLSLYYIQEPDWEKCGLQAGAVGIKNAEGAVFVQPVTVSVKPDREAPELYGVKKLYAYLDESIIYLDGVWAEDNADASPVITVDTSKVNTRVSGNYRVTYTATDYSGNSVSQKTEIVLMEPQYTAEYVYELADAVLAEIITPDMLPAEKLRAVFDWGRSHIKYGYGIGNKDWRRAAVIGFTKGTGDCFAFYATSRALLDRLGIDYIKIERLGSRSHHYWLLVNLGTGWYHFDTTVANKHKHECFMWTDEQCQIKPYFWRHDTSLYPAIATEPFDYEAEIARERALLNENQ